MKHITVFFLLVSLLIGCTSELVRPEGEPYIGYSCHESLMHFYSYCSTEEMTKEEFESKVQTCEKELGTKVCDKEQAGLLWCMGRVAPGTYSKGGGLGVAVGRGVVLSSGQSSTLDGCDCSEWKGAIRKCRMEKGIFDEKK